MLAYGIRVYRSVWRPIVRWAVSRRVVGHYWQRGPDGRRL